MTEIIAAPLHRVSEILGIPYRDLKGWRDEGLIAPVRVSSENIPLFSVKAISQNQADIESTYKRIMDSVTLGVRKEQLAQEIAGLIEKSRRQPARPEDVMAVQAKRRELANLEARNIRPQRRSAETIRFDIDQARQQRDVLEQRAKRTVSSDDIVEYRKAAMKVERLQKELASQDEAQQQRDTTELEAQLKEAEADLARLQQLAKQQPTSANMLRWGQANNKVKALRKQLT